MTYTHTLGYNNKVIFELAKFSAYLNKRFPLIVLFTFSLVTMLSIETFVFSEITYISILLAILYTCLLLHLRLLDEFKDYEFDTKNYKDRPIQSGLVDFTDIKNYLFLNFSFMALIVFVLQKSPLLAVVTFSYTLLMFKEFFIEDFSTKSPTFYLISHEFLFILFFYYVLNVLGIKNLLLLPYLFIPIVLIEIGRKMKHRFTSKKEKSPDTYAYIWGEKNTLLIFFTLCMINFLILYSFNPTQYLIYAVYILCLLYVLSLSPLRPILTKLSMVITITVSFAFPILLIL